MPSISFPHLSLHPLYNYCRHNPALVINTLLSFLTLVTTLLTSLDQLRDYIDYLWTIYWNVHYFFFYFLAIGQRYLPSFLAADGGGGGGMSLLKLWMCGAVRWVAGYVNCCCVWQDTPFVSAGGLRDGDGLLKGLTP